MRATNSERVARCGVLRRSACRALVLAIVFAFACTPARPEDEWALPGDDMSSSDAGPELADDIDAAADAETDAGDAGDASVQMPTHDVPDTAHCARVDEWDPLWTQFEEEVLLFTNEARVAGHNCDTHGLFEPTHTLTMEPRLRCAARMHALYMSEVADDFEHVTRAGVGPDDRVEQVNYDYEATGENIAVGELSPRQIVDGWLDSDGHCSNLMAPVFDEIGIGYAYGHWETDGLLGVIEAPYWVQNFGNEQ